ncbi:Zn-ribbon domain-containing OB-fold protein [Azoarcus sp. KH32C]|uniref:Zn-ribbon domain-containing OB-fold protein n=1 Tax=Azoarcus sp. KH32C TaxID=748247 RepID=UPI000238615B|nr:OB-fold domain-containing protein [Azoarcus sp. KH32C]BAL24582.1 hypothetical protein AZKH_2276 [Azoarcus sp. KH32C]
MHSLEHPKLACGHLVQFRSDGPSLLGSRCRRCDELYFPAARSCTRCSGNDLEAWPLGSEGLLWSWTIQGYLPKAPYDSGETDADFTPYGVGYVEMPSGIKVESRLTVADPAALRIGMRMALTLEPYRVAPDGEPIFTYAFAPALPAAA